MLPLTKRIVSLLYPIFAHISSRLKSKLRLNRNTILINAPIYPPQSDKYDFVMGSIDIINPADYDKIVAVVGPISKNILVRLSRLKWLQLCSHGSNGFEDGTWYKNKDIWVSCLKDVYSEAIAQYCITAYYLFNTFSFRTDRKNVHVSDCKIVRNVSILIYGMGNIGCELAKKCKSLGWTVYGVKRTKCNHVLEFVDDIYLPNEVGGVLATVDYVVNLLPENQDSIRFYDKHFFSQMKTDALFCNVGRKSAVVDQDLINAVKTKAIRGAILDAHNDVDYSCSNIILTGHNSSVSEQSQIALKQYIYTQLSEFLIGKKPKNTIQIK